jgi:hypothetical protein
MNSLALRHRNLNLKSTMKTKNNPPRFVPPSMLAITLALTALFLSPQPTDAQRVNGKTAPKWEVDSDTWVATDGLGRELVTAGQVGARRRNKTVGIFYFIWLGRHGERGPYDISRILTEDPTAMKNPDSPLWGGVGVPHHWGESIFGYYVSDDNSVLRKHAQMLGDAGVDMVVFDVTNQLTYPESWQALGRVFDEMRRAGNRVPQIAFLCPFWEPRKVVRELWSELYGKQLYPDLWFRWEGKPLILADPARLADSEIHDARDEPIELLPAKTLGQSFVADSPFDAVGGSFPNWSDTRAHVTMTLYEGGPKGKMIAERRNQPVVDNAWLMLELETPASAGDYYLEISKPTGKVGWWSSQQDAYPSGSAMANGEPTAGDRALKIDRYDEMGRKIRDFFTFRKPQPDYFIGPTGPEQWGWLEVYPQHEFYKSPGVVEQMTVGVAQNAADGKLSALSNPQAHGRSFHDGKQPGPEGQDATGKNFAEQWQRALKVDPPFIFITGWNEWIAGRFTDKAPFYGSGPVTFVDQFSQEYSRDIEPMRGGHGDAFYYQMVNYIRRYKGAKPAPRVRSQSIKVDGRFDDWTRVTPEFRDTIGDPVQRNYRGWGSDQHYVNPSGRYDLVSAKVSADENTVHFYVRIATSRSPADDPTGTTLWIDADHDATTGWLGYDFVVNRLREEGGGVEIEKNVENRYEWTEPKPVVCFVGKKELELAIPWDLLGADQPLETLDFKWTDNIRPTGEWSDFTLNGDAAPNDRFNYRAKMTIKTRNR